MARRAGDIGPRQKAGVAEHKESIRVALVDADQENHSAVREAFAPMAGRWALETYVDAAEAVHGIVAQPPRVVLMEISLPGLSGIECTRTLTGFRPGLAIVMLTARSDTETVLQSVIAGACGYLVKPVAARDLVRWVSRAVRGETAFCQAAEREQLEWWRRLGKWASSASLTPRELDLLPDLVGDRQGKEIASTRGMRPGTLRVHLTHFYAKLHVHNRAQAVKRLLDLR